ncbi:MAG TPA: UDP-N-acetylglucosamine 2-epimerase [Vitreimonas sp.]|nr:UDP-N-acetylglucosamine 2-epimerase [Vitreimonas sp.]
MSDPRVIAVLTTGRQDWGILHSPCAAIEAHPRLSLRLLVGGMHLSARHGRTIEAIRSEGIEVATELDWLGDEAEPSAEAQASAALTLVAQALGAAPPDALLLAGDRFETAAAALAATIRRVPIAHLHGGEQTLGAFDDALRHAITKLAHLHLVSHDEHARRVLAMGEDPATVHVVGSPGLDAASRPDIPGRDELAASLGIDLRTPVVVVTVHPATLDPDPAAIVDAVSAAMDEVPATYVITLPNVDPGGEQVRDRLLAAAARPDRAVVEALGTRRYWGLLRVADAMLGNSSSGIAEAPAVGLPAVNVGDRQQGRRRENNVIDVPAEPAAIAAALREALDPLTRDRIRAAVPPLADGRAGARIADMLAAWRPSIPPRKAPVRLPS